jgi:hypothetical protein
MKTKFKKRGDGPWLIYLKTKRVHNFQGDREKRKTKRYRTRKSK